MKSWTDRRTLHADFIMPMASAGLRSDAAAAAPVAAAAAAMTQGPSEPVPPQPLVDWLAQLTLLYGVPFEYLVPDPRLLPTESLRFFYIDQNWLDRLIDGALSIATRSSGDTVFTETFFESVYAAVQQAQRTLRATLRDKPLPDTVTVGGTLSGLMFRSVVVSGWPGLEIQATKAGTAVDILRMDRLAPDILLVLFNGVPDNVKAIEPSEGLHFGVIDDSATLGRYDVLLRGLGFGSYGGGVQIPDPKKAGQYLKASTTCRSGTGQPAGVLDIGGLVDSINANMPTGALGDAGKVTAGGFAIQMVRGAGLQAFTLTAAKDCTVVPAPK